MTGQTSTNPPIGDSDYARLSRAISHLASIAYGLDAGSLDPGTVSLVRGMVPSVDAISRQLGGFGRQAHGIWMPPAIPLNPTFHPPPTPAALSQHFQPILGSTPRSFYVVSRGRCCGVFSSQAVAEGFTKGVPHAIVSSKSSIEEALQEYGDAYRAGIVEEL